MSCPVAGGDDDRGVVGVAAGEAGRRISRPADKIDGHGRAVPVLVRAGPAAGLCKRRVGLRPTAHREGVATRGSGGGVEGQVRELGVRGERWGRANCGDQTRAALSGTAMPVVATPLGMP